MIWAARVNHLKRRVWAALRFCWKKLKPRVSDVGSHSADCKIHMNPPQQKQQDAKVQWIMTPMHCSICYIYIYMVHYDDSMFFIWGSFFANGAHSQSLSIFYGQGRWQLLPRHLVGGWGGDKGPAGNDAWRRGDALWIVMTYCRSLCTKRHGLCKGEVWLREETCVWLFHVRLLLDELHKTIPVSGRLNICLERHTAFIFATVVFLMIDVFFNLFDMIWLFILWPVHGICHIDPMLELSRPQLQPWRFTSKDVRGVGNGWWVHCACRLYAACAALEAQESF